ncbi:MAG TPA: Rieske 2Fe-2S domain-containing protein [Candidatus Limnocylindrales bacterium]|nr:Rieske 2Fe-2S domain-containing protein [Candidatus Limnocylindrales bacterium]
MSSSAPPSEPGASLTTGVRPIAAPALRASRTMVTTGFSRRTLLRRALGAAIGLWAVEAVAGTVGFAWSAGKGGGGVVRIGTFHEFLTAYGSLPVDQGFPAYVAEAKAFIVLIDPERVGWFQGEDETGDGRALNVRALYQRCPHLGCKPNPCLEDFWIHCPCHQSRYDRLGTKVDGVRYGPAARSMDRFGTRIDKDGVLFIDQTKLTLGPLPVALGQPGVIPPLVENGCA